METWWLCYLPLIFLLYMGYLKRKGRLRRIRARIGRKKGDTEMQELAKRFIGRDVLLYLISESNIDGILKEVIDNAVVIEKDGKENVVNLDYVVRMREYPVGKNGKRKSIVID